MTGLCYALFATPLGHCGIAWSPRGVVGLQLPESRDAVTRARLLRRHPDAREAGPPAAVQSGVDAILDLLGGAANDLSCIALDLEGIAPFERRVYEVARCIRPGATLTYGEVAVRLGEPGSARAVGQALGRNPFAIIVPCHRVLAAGGKPGGFSGGDGVSTKLRLLAIEGARIGGQRGLFE